QAIHPCESARIDARSEPVKLWICCILLADWICCLQCTIKRAHNSAVIPVSSNEALLAVSHRALQLGDENAAAFEQARHHRAPLKTAADAITAKHRPPRMRSDNGQAS